MVKVQLLNMYFTEPKKDSVAFNSYISRVNGFIANRDLDPQTVFFDSVRSLITSNHFRTKPLDVDRLKKVNLNDVYDTYTSRFNDPDDFTFIFVGNIQEDIFKEYVKKYLDQIDEQNILKSHGNLICRKHRDNALKFASKQK